VSDLPLFPVTTVGSWPRSTELLRAQKRMRLGQITPAAFDAEADRAVEAFVRLQERVGVDIVTDGEQRRDNFLSFVATKIDGVQMMTLAEMMEIIEDKAGFERILQTLDVPSYAISNPVCVGPISRREPIAGNEYAFLRGLTDKPTKVTLPGPYILTRAMWVKEAARDTYPTKEDLGEDVVRVLQEEVRELAAAGATFIQFDEPVLTELVFTQGETRTFMCAALAARKDPAEELEFAVSLMNRVVADLGDVRTAVHVCRGNWSRDEGTLLQGAYHPLRPYLERMHVKQLVLEYATERAGALVQFSDKELGLGVVNPRIDTVESPEEICVRAQRALCAYEPSRLFLNPDCGFGTFANRPMNSVDIATRKLEAMVAAARHLRAAAAVS
jgi:5-methyltetrahydropteroyltriglutamate--homocysteine methyltransferase